jgi:hypothetical protein
MGIEGSILLKSVKEEQDKRDAQTLRTEQSRKFSTSSEILPNLFGDVKREKPNYNIRQTLFRN